jgi:hypothetical protein
MNIKAILFIFVFLVQSQEVVVVACTGIHHLHNTSVQLLFESRKNCVMPLMLDAI